MKKCYGRAISLSVIEITVFFDKNHNKSKEGDDKPKREIIALGVVYTQTVFQPGAICLGRFIKI